MEPITIVGLVLAIVALAALSASLVEIWKRGVGAKIYLVLTTIGGSIAYSWYTNSPDAAFASYAQSAACFFPFSLLFALLLWVAIASLGLIGDGGFVSELMKELKRP